MKFNLGYCAASEDDDNLTVMFIVLAVCDGSFSCYCLLANLLLCKGTRRKGTRRRRMILKRRQIRRARQTPKKQPEHAKKADLEKARITDCKT